MLNRPTFGGHISNADRKTNIEGRSIVVGRLCQSVAGRGLVSGSRRNEVPKGGWSGAELWRSLPTTHRHSYKKETDLLGRLLCFIMRAEVLLLENLRICVNEIHRSTAPRMAVAVERMEIIW